MSKNPLLSLKSLKRTFRQGTQSLHILKCVDLDLYPGEIVALVGPSGSGKSTLLQTAGLLEKADGGDVIIEGKKCAHLNDRDRTQIRRDVLGFVYQFHHLLPEFSAEENIILPQMIAGQSFSHAGERA
ncbi:MAG: ATP-binding cassette domain-containing protein, partial [Alphaproteobacteria bacterium]|nr:ATP-binding cassette domain-containing protein [Alphaproteobacteria bacterium]